MSGEARVSEPALTPVESPKRMHSLDALRGFVIAAMLFVNMTWNREVFPGQFFHIAWNDPAQGATFTDLVFPWFVFIVGCATPLSMRFGRGRSQSAPRRLLGAARRALVLYLLGVLLTVAGQVYTRPLVWTDLLSWNILQLIGLAYFATVCIYLLPRWAQITFVVAVLLAKLATLIFIPWEVVEQAGLVRAAADAPAGPGTWAHFDGVKRLLHMEHAAGAGALLLGWLGMAQQWLPLAAIAVVGGWLTEVLASGRKELEKLQVVGGAGAALLLGAYLLQWGYDGVGGGLLGPFTVPFSKWLISPAYCLLSAGTGALLLVGCWWVIDAKAWTRLYPFIVYGRNAIALYFGAEFSFKVIWSKWQMPLPEGAAAKSDSLAGGFLAWVEAWTGSPAIAAWAFVIAWLVGWWVFCWWLDRRRIYIRV
ncbi:MAG: heparan-alpha-glucosaminide N-acetyltransferase domain-containing protein [Phycisphaerales bacterium JB038]